MNPLNLVPSWVWAAVVASLTATLFVLKMENTELSLEIENGKTYVSKIETAVAESNAIAAKKATEFEAKARQAEASATVRERVLAGDLRRSNTELERLRSTVASTRSDFGLRSSATTLAPNLNAPDLFPELFLDCSRRYVEVAGEADQWKSDAIKLYEAWPGGRIEQH